MIIFQFIQNGKILWRTKGPSITRVEKVLTKWISVNPTDYLFFDSFFQPLSSVKLNQ